MVLTFIRCILPRDVGSFEVAELVLAHISLQVDDANRRHVVSRRKGRLWPLKLFVRTAKSGTDPIVVFSFALLEE